MKTAKEWAAEVVALVNRSESEDFGITISDELGMLDIEATGPKHAQEDFDTAHGIIERLVERAQADVRTPLEGLLVEVRDALRDLHRYAADGSLEEECCDRLLPKIEEVLR